MDLELRHLRCLAAIVDSGTFTDAAIELGISQAAVSRNLMALEQVLGVRLLHRTSRSVTPTTAGVHVLGQARQILAAAGNLVAEATTGHTTLRIGHAWSAMGRHTREFQRRWAVRYPGVDLNLIRTNSPTGGLAEGLCDIAVLRTAADGKRFASAIVGYERRYCALAADDPWARRRSIRMDEIPQRTLLIDRRTGTTTPNLWPSGSQPRVRDTRDIDDWLAIVAAGGGSVHACRHRPADRAVPLPGMRQRAAPLPAARAPSSRRAPGGGDGEAEDHDDRLIPGEHQRREP
jgi:DNA-binding transcriptional LysR family regulator